MITQTDDLELVERNLSELSSERGNLKILSSALMSYVSCLLYVGSLYTMYCVDFM